ncbi:MAG TPA: cyclic nucleotide-binding domain-containing protein [Longimicrobiales bacterium]|nr:cyclic nucleotide-binding domain-containing protein [Longimicrobiales bacterium]
MSASLSQEQVREKLHSVALFQGLESADLERILGISESVLVEAGETVFEEGERGDHFFIIVRGEVELRKRSGEGQKKLAILREGQAFGEMALLNQTPRSASAHAVVDTYMLSISRAAFGQILGGDTLAVRLLRNLSRALWATSVRLASKQNTRTDTSHEALAEFNRLLRSRLLPRLTPRVTGYDLTASTLAPRQGVGASAWDWLLLTDGRPVFVVMRALRPDIFSAQRIATLRTLLRALSERPQESLGALLTETSYAMRAGWVDGLSGPVACALVALGDGTAEIAGAGETTALVVRSGGDTEVCGHGAPPAGERAGHQYESNPAVLGNRDKVILLSERPDNVVGLVTSVVTEGYTSSSRDALNKIFGRLGEAEPGRSGSDLTGAVITRTRAPG